jgi:hypothetical protein
MNTNILRIQGISDQLQPLLAAYGWGDVIEALALTASARADKAQDDDDQPMMKWADDAATELLTLKRKLNLA